MLQAGSILVACNALLGSDAADGRPSPNEHIRSNSVQGASAAAAAAAVSRAELLCFDMSPHLPASSTASSPAVDQAGYTWTSVSALPRGATDGPQPRAAASAGVRATSSVASDGGWGPRSHKGPAQGVLFAAHEDPSGALARVMAAAQGMSTKALQRRVKAAVAQVDSDLQSGTGLGG